MGMTAEDKWAIENGLPTKAELWAKLNDHQNYGQQTVRASEFFVSPSRLLQAMQELFGKGGE